MLAARAALLSRTERPARAFTSAANGNWNAVATWTDGADYPRVAGDTFTISHNVTIPAGVTARGGGTVASSKTLTNNGTLLMGSALTFASSGIFAMGPGALLDLGGFNVQAATGCAWTFVGDAGSRCTIRSTGGRGRFLSGVFPHSHTFQFCDITGLGASIHGRAHTSALVQIEEDCTFTDCEGWSVEDTATNVNAGFKFNRNRIRSMHAAGNAISFWHANQALGTAAREFTGNAFDGGGVLAQLDLHNVKSITWGAGQVIKDFQLNPTTTTTVASFGACVWYNSTGEDQAFFVTGSMPAVTWDGHYLYYNGGNHPFGYQTIAMEALNCIFEATNSNGGTDWFLRAANTTATTLTNCLFLGAGAAQTNTAANSGAITLSGVTSYTLQDTELFASLVLAEQSGFLSGATSVTNCLDINPDSTKTRSAIWLLSATAGQMDTANYNGAWAYSGGGALPRYIAGTPSPAAISGLGANDLQVDPLFVDRTRSFAAWGASLGGAGTAAATVAELLKINDADYNSVYNRADLIAWVGGGFVPTGAGATAYNATGSGGGNIGYRPPA